MSDADGVEVKVSNSNSNSWKLLDFTVGRSLGHGKFGNVYLARENATQRMCALKVIHKNGSATADMIRAEIENHTRALGCENILDLYGYFEDEKRTFMVLEYANGGEVFERLVRQKRFDEETAAKYIQAVVSGLTHCHANGVVHRDIKPENLLLCGGDDCLLKIADFGWSAHMPLVDDSRKRRKRRRSVCGTLDYMSPEMAFDEEYDDKVDVWAVGILLYEFLYGKPPFEASSTSETMKRIRGCVLEFPTHVEVSEEARDLISRILKKDPNERLTLSEILQHPWLLAHFHRKPDQSAPAVN